MAGAGWKDFVPGEVLSAANVQDYLQDQSVMVFASAAARTSALASPSEGMVTYLKDTDTVERFDGSSWVVPFSVANGGTGATTVAGAQDSLRVGLVNIVPTSVSVASGSGSFNSTSGLVTFSGATEIRLNGVFSADYKSYRIITNFDTSSGNNEIVYRLKTDSTIITANYDSAGARWSHNSGTTNAYNSSNASAFYAGHIDTDNSRPHQDSIDLSYPFQSKSTVMTLQSVGNLSGVGAQTYHVGGLQHASTSVTGLVIGTIGGTAQLAGTVQVYGYN